MTLGRLEQLHLAVELEGYTPGTPQFETVLRQRKVEACKDMKGLSSCELCPAFEHCEVLRAHLRDMHFGVPLPQ